MSSKDSTNSHSNEGSTRFSKVDPEYAEKDIVEVHVSPVHTFPEGGLQAWLTVLGGFLVQFVSFGYINAFGVYQDYYVRHYLTNYSPSDIGWIGGVQIFLNFSSGVLVGRAFDRGHFHKLMIAGILVHGLSLFMLSLSHQNSFYQVFLTNGVGLGLAGGLVYIPSLGIASHYFQRKRALGMGIISSGSALGAVLHPIMINRLLNNSSLGFHNTVRVSASLNVVLLVIAAILMRPRLPPKQAQKFPIGQWIREPQYAASLAASFFIFLGLFYPVFYLQLLANKKGIDPQLAFYAISILNAASFFGRIVPPGLSHLSGVMNMQIVAGISSGIVVCCMFLIKDVTGTILVAIFYGFFSGAAIALVPSVLGLLAKDVNELGTRIGINFVFGGVLGLVASPISGALLTKQYRWMNASLFAGLSLIVAGFFFGVSRHYLARARGTWRL